MNEDGMRTNLVTTFNCHDCGSVLTISTSSEKYAESASGEPTGAAMKAVRIFIHPCGKCVGELRSALKSFKKVMDLAGD